MCVKTMLLLWYSSLYVVFVSTMMKPFQHERKHIIDTWVARGFFLLLLLLEYCSYLNILSEYYSVT